MNSPELAIIMPVDNEQASARKMYQPRIRTDFKFDG